MDNNYAFYSAHDQAVDYFPMPWMPSSYYSPTAAPCPVHSPHLLYSSPPSTYYYQSQKPYLVTPVMQRADHTPLRQHKCFKKDEIQLLHQAYLRDAHPTINVIEDLATQLQVTVEKVRVSNSLLCEPSSCRFCVAMVQESTTQRQAEESSHSESTSPMIHTCSVLALCSLIL